MERLAQLTRWVECGGQKIVGTTAVVLVEVAEAEREHTLAGGAVWLGSRAAWVAVNSLSAAVAAQDEVRPAGSEVLPALLAEVY